MLCCILWLLVAAVVVINLIKFRAWKSCKPDFTGKRCFITGGSSGIGEELTKRLVFLGAKEVIIASRKVAEMERVKSECRYPERVTILELDMSKPEESMSRVQAFIDGPNGSKKGDIDIVFNNAGLTMREQFADTTFETCMYMMNVNCMAHIALAKVFVALFAKQKHGHFVNTVSVAGLIGTAYRTMYCTAKFGITGFFKALRAEVKQYNVSVTNVYPEYVKTNVSKNALLGKGEAFGKTDANIQKGMNVEDAVEIILKGTQLKLHELVVGRVFFHVIPHVMFLSSKINDILGDAIFKQTKEAIAKAE